MLENADQQVLDMLHRLLDELKTHLSSILAGAYLSLVLNGGWMNKKERPIAEPFKTLTPQEVSLRSTRFSLSMSCKAERTDNFGWIKKTERGLLVL